jgi:hypothetical protein
VEPDVGLVIGERGTMIRTENGGILWQLQYGSTQNALRGMWFTGKDKGIVVGDYGTILRTGADNVSGVERPGTFDGPGEFALAQNYPNPFNPATTLMFRISEAGSVSLKIYDLLGREVAVLVNEQRPPGTYSVRWDASRLPSGIYFYRLQAGNRVATKKMVLLK